MHEQGSLFGARVFCDGFCSLRNGVFRQFTWQQESHRRLNFSARDCRSTIVNGQSRRLGCDSLEDVVDERVHDAHGFRGDASVWVNLLQHFVNVHGIGLLPLLSAFAFAFYAFRWLDCFLCSPCLCSKYVRLEDCIVNCLR